MRKIKEILRLHYSKADLSNRQIAEILKISKTTVRRCLDRFKSSGLNWPLADDLTEQTLNTKLYSLSQTSPSHIMPDWTHIHNEMIRPHVTLQLLWDEYKETYPDGVGRSRFYFLYRQYKKVHLSPSMRILHKGGDKLFVDYSGDGLEYIDRSTGEIIPVELFVASWGASSYSYAEATYTQQVIDWIQSHVHAYRYFGCVPNATVPDNTKSGITKANFYDPDINPTYAQLAEYYDTVILPARVRKPKDKAAVETNVLHIQRFILGRLRDRKFFSLHEINEAIRIELENFNSKPMQLYKVPRKERFLELDKPYAKPIPAEDFPYIRIKPNVTVHKDYHVNYNDHFYSVPYELCGQKVEVWQTNRIIEIFHDNTRVASHKIGMKKYGFTTLDAHMPKEHRFVKGWSPGFFLNQALKIGDNTVVAVKKLLEKRFYPELGYRSILGIINLTKKYPKERIEKAAERAVYYNQISRKSFLSILQNNLDKEPLNGKNKGERKKIVQQDLFHENIRGADYYNS